MAKDKQRVARIEVLPAGEMQLVLESAGSPEYQFIYREAAEVYWVPLAHAFQTPKPRKWSYAEWLQHVLKVCRNFGVNLEITKDTQWVNVPAGMKGAMDASNVT